MTEQKKPDPSTTNTDEMETLELRSEDLEHVAGGRKRPGRAK